MYLEDRIEELEKQVEYLMGVIDGKSTKKYTPPTKSKSYTKTTVKEAKERPKSGFVTVGMNPLEAASYLLDSTGGTDTIPEYHLPDTHR